MRHKFLVFFLCTTLCTIWLGCGSNGSGSSGGITRAFYIWQSGRMAAQEDSLLAGLGVGKCYIRFFDVDVEEPGGAPYPIERYYDSGMMPTSDSLEVVPTVFITNRTFTGLSDTGVVDLANRIHKKINAILNREGEAAFWQNEKPDYGMRDLFRRDSINKATQDRIREIQFDCDWTPSTKNKYFLFLKKMKEKFAGKIISSTIRLYGYKYPEKAGVPPVDKGMLMCYNAGDVRNAKSGNSIFDKKEILSYLDTEKPYPLPLDYALPIFEWCALYRNGDLIGLLPTENIDFTCYDFSCPFERDENSSDDLPVYRVKEEYTLGYTADAQLMKIGDVIKVERPDLTDVAAVARQLGKGNTNPKPVVSLFDFKYNTVKSHEKAIRNIYDSF